MHHTTGHITPIQPFDFAQQLRFIGLFSPAAGEQTINEQALTKAVMLDGQVVAFKVRSLGTVDKPELEYTLYSEGAITDAIKERAVDLIAFYLSANDDLRPFYEIGNKDEDFAPVIKKLYALHQVKFLTPFENAAWSVMTQRNPIVVARKTKQKVIERYGGSVEVDGETHWAFPDAQALSVASPEDLFALLKNEKRTAYLRNVISAFQDVDEDWLRTGDYDEVYKWLRSIKGIGEWSAAFVMIRGLGRMERLTSVEENLMNTVSHIYKHDQPVSRAEVEEIGARYGNYAGHWAFYMRNA
ncbi:MAG: hypothetical protein ABIQ44_06695 [Chloroflexia bacterium]